MKSNTNKCMNCRWFGSVFSGTWHDCENKLMDETFGGMVHAGGEDGYGDYFRVSGNFGCVNFEPINS